MKTIYLINKSLIQITYSEQLFDQYMRAQSGG